MAAKKHSGPFIVAFGGEAFLLDRMIELGRSWADRRIVVIDGEGRPDHEIVTICEQRSFDGRDVVVVVDNAHKIKGDKALKAFIEEKTREDDSVVVVAILRTDKLPELWKAAAEKGRTQHFPKCKPWESDKVKQRMVAEAERPEAKISGGLCLELAGVGVLLAEREILVCLGVPKAKLPHRLGILVCAVLIP